VNKNSEKDFFNSLKDYKLVFPSAPLQALTLLYKTTLQHNDLEPQIGKRLCLCIHIQLCMGQQQFFSTI